MSKKASAPRIEFRDVSLAFDERVVLDHVSFTVAPAEMKVMLGESGGGKSTIIRLTLGLLQPDSGHIFIDGGEITQLSEEELNAIRARMGVVFQEGALFDSLSVFENVAYRLRERGDSEDSITSVVQRMLEFVGLEDSADKMPAELSGGMKRRVAIARAVVDEPEIVLFDEPTAGLDPPTARTICLLGVKLRDVKGVSSIWITHRIEDVRFLSSKCFWGMEGELQLHDGDEKLCQVNTKFVMLHKGQIIFEGTDEELWQSDDPFVRKFLEFDAVQDRITL